MSVPPIARMWMTDEEHVRRVIHDFNRDGFDSLRPRFGGGRPRRISSEDEQRIVALAGARPQALGVPYTRWSLAKLSRYLAGEGIAVSPAHLGRILARRGAVQLVLASLDLGRVERAVPRVLTVVVLHRASHVATRRTP